MHDLQSRLLRLIQEKNLGQLTLDEIGDLLGIRPRSPQKVKHHLSQLEKKGLIRIDKTRSVIEKTDAGAITGLLRKGKLFAIPILGAANAGPAQLFAEPNIEGYLRVSNALVGRRSARGLFVLKVSGPSMNRATIGGKKIEDGDYVIIDSEHQEPGDGDIVLSVIDGMANIKRLHFDKVNGQIVLMSDSTHNYPPVFIHEDDDYMLNGKVIQVIKKPKTA
jgi:SOS-response transcriptional repressor LexA